MDAWTEAPKGLKKIMILYGIVVRWIKKTEKFSFRLGSLPLKDREWCFRYTSERSATFGYNLKVILTVQMFIRGKLMKIMKDPSG